MRLRHNAAWMVLGQGIFSLCQWLTLVVLARLGGPDEVGQFALAFAVVTPITLFSSLQMRQIYVADVAGRAPFGDYLAVRLVTTAMAAVVVVGLTTVGGFEFATAGVLIAFATAKAVESVSDIYYGVAQRQQRLDLVGKSMMIRGASGLTTFAVTYHFTRVLWVSIFALALAWLLTWFLFDRRVVESWLTRAAPQGGLGTLRRLVWLGLPLGAVLMLGALNTNIPRYFIEAHLGTEALGIFAAMAYFTVAGELIIHALGQAASARLARQYALEDRSEFRDLLGRMVLLAALLGLLGIVIAWLFGEKVLALAYGAKFALQPELFVLVMTVALVSYLAAPFGYAMTAMQRFQVQFFLFLIVILINASGCWLLTPSYGMQGAVLGWGGGLLSQLLLGAGVTFWALRRPSSERCEQ